jgi:hypothetical protein
MKTYLNNKSLCGEYYTAPTIEIFEIKLENGFQGDIPTNPDPENDEW